MDKQIEKLLKSAPPLREEELKKINEVYPAFLFRERKTRKIWTSCCGREETLEEYDPLLYEEHQPEQVKRKYAFYCSSYIVPEAPKVQKTVQCPYCGQKAVMKEAGRCGKGNNLYSFHRVIVLRWYQNALWGMGYSTEKAYYPQSRTFTRLPSWKLTRVWRFTPGRVQYAERDWWDANERWYGYRDIDTKHLKAGWKCPDGFSYCAEYGKGYDVVCTEELDKSPWKYCNVKHYLEKSSFAMCFLALCTGYPQQVEMLLKGGLTEIVDDMVVKGKLNAAILKWNEPNVLRSFGVPKDVMQDWLETGGTLRTILAWKTLHKHGIRAEINKLNVLYTASPYQFEKTVKNMKNLHVSAEKLLNYFEKQQTEKIKISSEQEYWNDYIYAAERIGYDLTNPVFLLPRDLSTAHDKATKAYAALKKDIENEKYRAERLQKLKKKYTFWSDRWLIRPPSSAAEIVAEGKALKHCVGGYADRHINGKVTILFLRDRQRPGKPLVTIEMNGNHIVQIHGWDDERTKCKENPNRESPQKIYKEFLDEWLAWLKSGSKKDKKGYPIILKEAKTA